MNLIHRHASACWEGGVKGGNRVLSTGSGVLRKVKLADDVAPDKASGTDPVELVAAAHASSFSLALSQELGLVSSGPGEIITTVTATVEYLAAGWTISKVHLEVAAKLPVTQGEFIDAAVRAKTTCMISRMLRVNISMNAKLEQGPGEADEPAE